MTRFQQEIKGLLGDYWKRNAEQKVEEYVNKVNNDAIIESDGAIKWKSNENYLMDDLCEILEYANYNFSRENTRIKREKATECFLEEYRKNNQISEEELWEMKSVFGTRTTIVDVISGKKYEL